MSIVTYNGVSLPYPFATQYAQSAVHDDVSGTDWCLTKYGIQIQTVVNSNYLNQLAPDLVGTTTNPAAIMKVVRNRLLEPRKTLSYTVNGVELMPQKQSVASGSGTIPGTVDAKNGPIPQSCNITQLNNTSFLINYHIVAHYWENIAAGTVTGQNRAGNDVLFNRWTESVHIDQCMYTTRTRQGKYAIRSDNVDGKLADELRTQFAVVALPDGFLRQSANYSITPDGLSISYSIVDKEVHRLPPKPAYEASGTYTETAAYGLTGFRQGVAKVHLRGRNAATDTEREALIAVAVALACAKLDNNNFTMLSSATCTVDMFDNTVDCQVTGMLKASDPSNPIGSQRHYGVWSFDFPALASTAYNVVEKMGPNGVVIPAQAGPIPWQPTLFDYGTSSLLLQAAAYYDPSLRQNKLNPTTGQMEKGTPPGEGGVTPGT